MPTSAEHLDAAESILASVEQGTVNQGEGSVTAALALAQNHLLAALAIELGVPPSAGAARPARAARAAQQAAEAGHA